MIQKQKPTIQQRDTGVKKLYVANLDTWILGKPYRKSQQFELTENEAKSSLVLGHIQDESFSKTLPQLNVNNSASIKSIVIEKENTKLNKGNKDDN